MLAIDVSRSMKATDVQPTRLDAARTAAKTFLDEVPQEVPGRRRLVRDARGRRGRPDRRPHARHERARHPDSGRGDGDRRRRLALAASRAAAGHTRRSAAARDRRSSRTGPGTAARSIPPTPPSRRSGRACRSTPCSSARRTASSQEKLTGGFTADHPRPARPGDAPAGRAAVRGRVLRRSGRRGPPEGLRGSRLAARDAQGGSRGHGRLRGRSRRSSSSSARPRRPSSSSGSREGRRSPRSGARRRGGGARRRGDRRARRTSATGCRSACPSPGRGSSFLPRPRCRARRVEWQVTCPTGHVAGGLDARLSVRAIDVAFLGTLGSPVNPGISTSRSVVFLARMPARRVRRRPSSRSSAACRRRAAARACRPRSRRSLPGKPVTRRVATVRVRPGSALVVQRCARGRAADRRLARLRVRDPHAAERESRLEHLRHAMSSAATRSRFASAATPSSRESARSSRCRRSARGRDDQLQEPVAAPRPAPARRRRRDLAPRRAQAPAVPRAVHERRGARDGRVGTLVAAARSRRRSCSPLSRACSSASRARRSQRQLLKEHATVILVVDTSRSMQAKDVAPTRLGAAQQAIKTFLDHAPKGLRVGLVVFAGEAQVATPPTKDHALVETSVEQIDQYLIYGGTAIGDALQTAVELGKQVTGPEGSGPVTLGDPSAPTRTLQQRRLRRASARTRAPSRSSSSRTARRRAACCSRSKVRRSRSAPASPSTQSRWGRRTA